VEIDPVSRVYLSEDYLFCKLWAEQGGDCWLDLNTNLNHTGLLDYRGCLSITINEVDVLNKDAQIMRQQLENDAKVAGKTGMVAGAGSGSAAGITTDPPTDKLTREDLKNKMRAKISGMSDERKRGDIRDVKDVRDVRDGTNVPPGNCDGEVYNQLDNTNHC
jgi:hypothetical protein